MTSHQTRVRVRYAETDQMGVVYYANYLIWMELGRAEYCRAAGLRYRDLEENEGVRLAVVEAHCRYLSPARYDDEIVITTSILNSNRRIVEFAYDMRAEDGHTVATGSTKHMFLGPNMKPVKLPEKYYELFRIGVRSPFFQRASGEESC